MDGKFSYGLQEYTYHYLGSDMVAALAIMHLHQSKSLTFGLDIETGKKTQDKEAGLDPHRSFIRLLQIFDPATNSIFVFDIHKIGMPSPIKMFLESRQFVAHNAIFELKHINRDEEILKNVHCSMLMGILVDRAERSPFEADSEEEEQDEENGVTGVSRYRKRGGYSLANLCFNYLGSEPAKELQVSDWNKENLTKEQIAYAALDAVLTHELGVLLFKKIAEYKLTRAYKLLKQMQHVVARMENTGFYLDVEAHKKLIEEWNKEKILTEKACKPYFGETNLNSSKQMNAWVKEYFKDKKHILNSWPVTDNSIEDKKVFSFNRTALAGLVSLKEIEALLKYKKVTKLISTYGETLLEKINPVTKRLHCSFILGETRTGRLSSRAPNLQNIPRDATIKQSFCAEEGNILVAADFSQIEMRVAAELSKDPVMLDAFKKGVDLHKYIVSVLAKKPIDKVTKEERQLGKAINFGLLFGMGAPKLTLYAKMSYGVTLTEEEAYNAWKTFHTHYKKYSAWCDVQRNMCSKLGFVRTPLGRMRKLTEEEVYTKAVNTPVQGGAAEVAFAALVTLHNMLQTNFVGKIINTIHDEIIVECKECYAKEVGSTLKQAMVEGMLYVFPRAVTYGLVDVKYGKSWADTKS